MVRRRGSSVWGSCSASNWRNSAVRRKRSSNVGVKNSSAAVMGRWPGSGVMMSGGVVKSRSAVVKSKSAGIKNRSVAWIGIGVIERIEAGAVALAGDRALGLVLRLVVGLEGVV